MSFSDIEIQGLKGESPSEEVFRIPEMLVLEKRQDFFTEMVKELKEHDEERRLLVQTRLSAPFQPENTSVRMARQLSQGINTWQNMHLNKEEQEKADTVAA